jgi:hypothetical protein
MFILGEYFQRAPCESGALTLVYLRVLTFRFADYLSYHGEFHGLHAACIEPKFCALIFAMLQGCRRNWRKGHAIGAYVKHDIDINE